jgi:twinkle protein
MSTATIEPHARNAAPNAARNATLASRSTSTGEASDGTAGIAGTMAENSSTRLSAEAAAWAQSERHLSRATLERLGVASGTAWFPDAGAKLSAIYFRYSDGWKARAFPDKHFVAGKGFKLAFWNLGRVLRAAPATVFIAEGEFDVCALVEAGISEDAVLSVPNGAKERPAEDPKEQRGYAYVDEALTAGLNRVKRVVWVGDGDGPGLSLRADMARLFGAARFYFVGWPEGVKDPNDMLRADGPEALHALVTEGALPWPTPGLFRLGELPEPAPMTIWQTGFAGWDSKIKLAPGTLSVVTGHPGHGKTLLLQQIWFQVARQYGVGVCIASFETRAKPHIRRQLRTLHSGLLERDMDLADMRRADEWIDERYSFMVHPEQRPTLQWFLDTAEVAVVRHGARIVQLDPWNRLEAARGQHESETDYIARCLRTLHVFAQDFNVHVQVLAHPAKMDSARRGSAPLLEDISGSKHWDNMVDQGFAVHRPKIFDGANRKTDVQLFHRKARFDELGFPCMMALDYRVDHGRYFPIESA